MKIIKSILVIVIIFFISITSYVLVNENMDKNTDKEIIKNDIIKNEFEDINNYIKENIDRYNKYKENNNNNLSNEEIVNNVNLNLDYAFYENISDALNLNANLILVNKYYKLNNDYIPNNIINIDSRYASRNDIYANEEAAKHFYELCTDASNLNLIIKTISAYRTYEYQDKLYSKYLENDPQELVDTYSARPGHSEHQTGLAFDIYNTKVPYTSFGDTEEFEWLKDNAHIYGFIIRYTKEKEYITGYKNESWHIRYVGIENAKIIYDNNISLEEYIANKNNY